jgi:enediyne biosynthesis protein E4
VRRRASIPLIAAAVLAAIAPATLQEPPAGGAFTFTDVTAPAGIRFLHENGAAGDKWYPELFGGGVVVLDLDADGWPDLLFVNGKPWAASATEGRHRLYRNNRDGTFGDVTAGSGFDTAGIYGLGAAVADFDNDGRDDVFMTAVNGGRLFRNQGGGRFVDVTTRAGIANTGFSVSAAWLDYDRDGRPDLVIGNYVRWSPALEVRCTQDGVRGYCGPDAYKPTAPTLYRNLGGGRFADVTTRAGMAAAGDKVMGVAVLDFNGDGWSDVFIGSDRVPARLYRNSGRGTFVDDGLPAGVALSEQGVARANMGVDAADFERSGRPGILVGNFVGEMLGLYRNTDGRFFTDVAPRSEVGRASLLSVTWAVFFLDADLDGWLDIFALNGGTDESQGMDQRARLSMAPLLLRNRGNGSFEDISRGLGAAFTRPVMGRGAAYADFDGDGDLDLALTTLNGAASLLRNDSAAPRHWLQVRAVGAKSTRSGLGTVVRVSGVGGTQTQVVRSGSSYASQSDLAITFGLGRDTAPVSVEVAWPSGTRQVFPGVAVDQAVVVDEARGLQIRARPSARPAPAAGAPPR